MPPPETKRGLSPTFILFTANSGGLNGQVLLARVMATPSHGYAIAVKESGIRGLVDITTQDTTVGGAFERLRNHPEIKAISHALTGNMEPDVAACELWPDSTKRRIQALMWHVSVERIKTDPDYQKEGGAERREAALTYATQQMNMFLKEEETVPSENELVSLVSSVIKRDTASRQV